MKADASAPATTRPKMASGILNAAQNASSSGVSPKCAPMTERRSQPRIRLATRVTIMIAEARAIDIGKTVDIEASGIVRTYAGKEAQALGPQTHPSDPAAHVHADDRPLRGADRRADRPRGHRQGRRGRIRGHLGGGERAGQSRQARLDPQEQCAPAAEQDRESGDEGEEEKLAAELLLDLVELFLAVHRAGQVKRFSSGGPYLRQQRPAQRLLFPVRPLGKPEPNFC